MRSHLTTGGAALAAGLLLSGCGGDSTSAPPTATVAATSAPLPLVVDTDVGVDDAIALLYLATSPDVDLRAVTVSGTGLAHCFPGALNVVGLLQQAGRSDVPVACGREDASATGGQLHPFPRNWRSGADSRYGNTWPIGTGEPDERAAAVLLAETIATSDEPVTLVTLGPLTNLADALALDADLGAGVERVVAMAGAFDVPGNTADAETPPERNVAEWNVYADPLSAQAVVRAGLPLTFVPLDATNGVPLDAYVLRAAASAPTSEALEVTNALLDQVRGLIGAGAYYLWDPLAAVLTLRPDLATTEPRRVDVLTAEGEGGRTVATDAGTPAVVVTAADGRAAELALLEGLAGAPVPAIDERPDLVIDPASCRADGTQLAAGPRVVELDPAEASHAVVLGTLDPGRGLADIEAFLAEPTGEGPEWFTTSALLGGGAGSGPPSDMVRLQAGEYTAVCLRDAGNDRDLVGMITVSVLPAS